MSALSHDSTEAKVNSTQNWSDLNLALCLMGTAGAHVRQALSPLGTTNESGLSDSDCTSVSVLLQTRFYTIALVELMTWCICP